MVPHVNLVEEIGLDAAALGRSAADPEERTAVPGALLADLKERAAWCRDSLNRIEAALRLLEE